MHGVGIQNLHMVLNGSVDVISIPYDVSDWKTCGYGLRLTGSGESLTGSGESLTGSREGLTGSRGDFDRIQGGFDRIRTLILPFFLESVIHNVFRSVRNQILIRILPK